jgi:hypothetical protein
VPTLRTQRQGIFYLSYSDLPWGVPDLLPLYVQEKKPYYSIRVAEPPYAHSRVKKPIPMLTPLFVLSIVYWNDLQCAKLAETAAGLTAPALAF